MVITIPLTGLDRCLLKDGQTVDFDTPFLEKKVEEEVTVAVAKNLDVSPQKIFHYLKKFVGESIKKNDIIAVNKGLFTSKKIISKYTGLIKDINHSDGSIVIASETEIEKTINCFFRGKVDKIKKNEVTIRVEKGEELPAKNVVRDFGGKVFYADDNLKFLSENISDSIIVCENITPYLKAKAEALGCWGFLSVSKLAEESGAAYAQFKNINDFKKILKLKFPYCAIISASSIIYFYQ